MTAVIIFFFFNCKIPGSIFRGLSCSLGADNESQNYVTTGRPSELFGCDM